MSMLETKGNLFDIDCNALCITTNGFTKANGECVMGKGCAKQVADMLPEVPKLLGDAIKRDGNCVHHLLTNGDVALFSYPVKPISEYANEDKSNVVRHMQAKFKEGMAVPGGACIADIEIIKRSAREPV